MKRYDGKAVLITGAAGFIGGECARRFAAEGAKVFVCDVAADGINRTVKAIREAGGTADGTVCDVTDSASCNAAVAACVKKFGRLDVMAHVAGGSARSRIRNLVDQVDEVIDWVLKVNLYGAIYMSRAAAREMIAEKHGGRILCFSSTVGVCGLAGCVDYAAAKGGVMSAVRAMAKELGAYGITVNSVAPGIVMRPEEGDSSHRALDTNVLHEKCTAADVASLVLYLCSDEARFVTGQTYIMDGGRSLSMKGTD